MASGSRMRTLDRRQFLLGSAALSLAPFLKGCSQPPESPWERGAYRKTGQSRVAVLPARDYTVPLKDILVGGLKAFPLGVQGKTVVLKPNLVEYDPGGVINTHPALIAATIEAFRSLGAREVLVAEGPGHRRDHEYLLTASGLYSVLEDAGVRYVDLNHDDVRPLALRSHFTTLRQLYYPETILRADLLVSMPKLKTHHWAGVTLALKNMFGIIPGSIYGWPKNVLHWAGIQESILDINSTLPAPQFSIVDGIVGMEGNGPIQGEPRHCGVLVLGDDPVAVDATAARLMKIEPRKVPYLEKAEQFLGNIARERIAQIGEDPERFAQEFKVIESFKHLAGLSE
jgi:uncharacterized protein (DUF362 family)